MRRCQGHREATLLDDATQGLDWLKDARRGSYTQSSRLQEPMSEAAQDLLVV